LVLAGLGVSSLLNRLGVVDPGQRLLWGGAPAFLIAAGVILTPNRRRDDLFSRALVLCGGASYALYLTHMFTLRLLTEAWSKFGLGAPGAYLACGFVLAIAASVGVHLWVEQPILALLNRWIGTRPRGSGR